MGEVIEDSYPPFWQRAATSPKSYALNMGFFYHQTMLQKVQCSFYDEMRRFAPEPKHVRTSNRLPGGIEGYCFVYLADSFEFLFLQFLKKQTKEKLLRENAPLLDRAKIELPVFIVAHQQELDEFIEYLNSNLDADSISGAVTVCPLGERHPASQASIDFAYSAKKVYLSWKQNY